MRSTSGIGEIRRLGGECPFRLREEKLIMSKNEEKSTQDASRKERLERIKRLLKERQEDAAKILKTWISSRDEDKKKP